MGWAWAGPKILNIQFISQDRDLGVSERNIKSLNIPCDKGQFINLNKNLQIVKIAPIVSKMTPNHM